MTRKKVKLELIQNDSERRVSYRKRKNSLMKLTKDLTTLCGTEACVVVYSPYESKPEIWPSESGVLSVLEKFKTLPEWQKSKKMMNQGSFISQTIHNGRDKMKKLVGDNKKKEMTMLMFQCLNTGMFVPNNNMSSADLNVLSSVIEQNLRDIGKRLETLNNVSDMTTTFQPQMQTSSYSYQPQKQTPELLVASEGTNILNYGHGSDMKNVDPLDSHQWVMSLLNGNEFGDANLQF